MKTFILLLTLSAAGFAHASSNICGQLFPCGTYSVEDAMGPHPVTRQFVFTAVGDNDVQMDFVTIDNGARTVESQLLNFNPDGKGLFTSYNKKGDPSVAGICQNDACIISTPPFLHKGEQSEQAIVLRFRSDSMQLGKLFVDDKGGALHTNGIFKKIP